MSLVHRLVVGHFDLSAGNQFVATRSIDFQRASQMLVEAGAKQVADGEYELDGGIVFFSDGYVTFPWLSYRTNEQAVTVAEALAKDQHAILAEECVLGLRGPKGGIFYPPELANDKLR